MNTQEFNGLRTSLTKFIGFIGSNKLNRYQQDMLAVLERELTSNKSLPAPVLLGNRRMGSTTFSLAWIYALAQRNPNQRTLVIFPNKRSLEASRKRFHQALNRRPPLEQNSFSVTTNNKRDVSFINGHSVMFAVADSTLYSRILGCTINNVIGESLSYVTTGQASKVSSILEDLRICQIPIAPNATMIFFDTTTAINFPYPAWTTTVPIPVFAGNPKKSHYKYEHFKVIERIVEEFLQSN